VTSRSVTWVFVVVACGARTPLGGTPSPTTPQADADVPDVAPSTIPPSNEPCDPLVFQSGGDPQASFVLAHGFLHYKAKDGVMRTPWNDATPSPVAADVADLFAVDGTSLFWVDAKKGYIASTPVTGGATTKGTCGAPSACPPTVSQGSRAVGVTDAHAITSDYANFLFSFPKNDLDADPALLITDGPPTALVVAFASSGEHVFWITDEYVFEVEVGVTKSVKIDDGWPSGLTIHAGDVYWTAAPQNTSRLVHRAVSGGPTNIVYTGELHDPLGANDAFVYGVSKEGIIRVDVSNGSKTVIEPKSSPKHLAVYGACVFVMDPDGLVRRLPG